MQLIPVIDGNLHLERQTGLAWCSPDRHEENSMRNLRNLQSRFGMWIGVWNENISSHTGLPNMGIWTQYGNMDLSFICCNPHQTTQRISEFRRDYKTVFMNARGTAHSTHTNSTRKVVWMRTNESWVRLIHPVYRTEAVREIGYKSECSCFLAWPQRPRSPLRDEQSTSISLIKRPLCEVKLTLDSVKQYSLWKIADDVSSRNYVLVISLWVIPRENMYSC